VVPNPAEQPNKAGDGVPKPRHRPCRTQPPPALSPPAGPKLRRVSYPSGSTVFQEPSVGAAPVPLALAVQLAQFQLDSA
jgi:hypothetical protein